MTIKELTEKLKQYPDTAEVYVVNKWGNWQKITETVPGSDPRGGPAVTAVCLRGGSHA